MITPIRALTIEQICERKDDLLISNDDIHKLAKHVKEQAIDEFAERLLENTPRNWAGGLELGGLTCYLSANKVMEIAEQMKEKFLSNNTEK